MNTPALADSSPTKSPHSQVASPCGGYFLPAEDCRTLEQGFGLPVSQILRDMVEQARFDNARRR